MFFAVDLGLISEARGTSRKHPVCMSESLAEGANGQTVNTQAAHTHTHIEGENSIKKHNSSNKVLAMSQCFSWSDNRLPPNRNVNAHTLSKSPQFESRESFKIFFFGNPPTRLPSPPPLVTEGATQQPGRDYSSDTASRFSLMMVSMTTWKTTWMLEVSVAVVKWW